jgi:hypothetical protein
VLLEPRLLTACSAAVLPPLFAVETNLTATVFAPLDKNIQEALAADPALAALADDEVRACCLLSCCTFSVAVPATLSV